DGVNLLSLEALGRDRPPHQSILKVLKAQQPCNKHSAHLSEQASLLGGQIHALQAGDGSCDTRVRGCVRSLLLLLPWSVGARIHGVIISGCRGRGEGGGSRGSGCWCLLLSDSGQRRGSGASLLLPLAL